MSADVDFPNNRLEYSGHNNPRFVSDIVNLTQDLLQAMQSILGLNSTDFAIISGFDYLAGTPGSYQPGICYMNGVFYYSKLVLSEGFYLTPNVTDVLPKLFSDDSISRNTYRIYYAVSSNSQYGGIPVFSGNMNAYRLNLKFVNSNLQGIVTALNASIQTQLISYAKLVYNNVNTYDFQLADLIQDGNIHSLNVANKVGVNAKFALVHLAGYSTLGAVMAFSKYGITVPGVNASYFNVPAGGNLSNLDLWLPLGYDNANIPYINYRLQSGTLSSFGMVIGAYM